MIRWKVLWVSLTILLLFPTTGSLIIGLTEERKEFMLPGYGLLLTLWVTLQVVISLVLALANGFMVLYYRKSEFEKWENSAQKERYQYHRELLFTYLLTAILVALVGFSICFGTSSLVEVIRNE